MDKADDVKAKFHSNFFSPFQHDKPLTSDESSL